MRKTKIVCTVGPATDSAEKLTALVQAGMNVMRLNFSHGDYAEHQSRINLLRQVSARLNKPVAILLDTQGPEIRTLPVVNDAVQLSAGATLILTNDTAILGTAERVGTNYAKLVDDVLPGQTILLDDGLIALTVESIHGQDVHCRIENSGELGGRKGVNLPGASVSLPALSEKDRQDLIFGCDQGVDFVAASFIRKPSDVLEIRAHLEAHGGQGIQIIAKIENAEGVRNFDQILDVADGIMVARGDLGVEIPVEEVIFAQKHMIRQCNLARKPVITATQMLDSMIKNPRPTRAEAGDVSNAILDGTDAVMLSGESAKGLYPIEAVNIMAQICVRTDNTMVRWRPETIDRIQAELAVTESVCRAAVDVATILKARAIVVSSFAGRSVRSVRKYFPTMPMLALTTLPQTLYQLCLIRGVTAQLVTEFSTSDQLFKAAKEHVMATGLAKVGDTIVVVSGALVARGSTNSMSVHRL